MAAILRSRHSAFSARRATRPPVTLHGPLLQVLRVFWVAVAVASLLVWIAETPYVYQAALQLHNTSGEVNLTPEEWRIGLQRLGLSSTVYAVQSVVTLGLWTGAMFVTGLLIFLRRSSDLIALLVSYTFVALGPGVINAYAAGAALIKAHPELKWLLQQPYMAVSLPAYAALFLLPLLFPDGRFVPRWTGWLIPIFFLSLWSGFQNFLPSWIQYSLGALWFGTVLIAPIYRYRRVSDPAQREQTKWVMLGLVVTLGLFTAAGLVQMLVPGLKTHPGQAVLVALIDSTVVYLGFIFLPISFGIAIVRYRLYDIDLLINRTLVYGLLTVSLGLVYLVGVIALQALFRALTGQGSNVAVAISTLTIAALFQPLRRRIQSVIDQRFYRSKYDAARTLAAFQVRLRDEVDLDQLRLELISVVQETMQPESIGLWLRPSDVSGSGGRGGS